MDNSARLCVSSISLAILPSLADLNLPARTSVGVVGVDTDCRVVLSGRTVGCGEVKIDTVAVGSVHWFMLSGGVSKKACQPQATTFKQPLI